MTFSRTGKLLLIVTACTGVAAWWGYRGERHAMAAAGAPKTTVRTMVKRLVTPAAKRAGTDRLEELRQAIGRNHPSREEAAALWAVVRGFSVEEVKAALEALPSDNRHRVNGEIGDMLYYRWAQLDPETAATEVLASGDESRRLTFHTVLAAWAQRDPEAAIRWGRDSGNHSAVRAAMQLAARQWLLDDPATALARAKAEFPDAVLHVVRNLTSKLAGTPESRRELFAMLAKDLSGDDGGLFSGLSFDLGQPDPAGVEEIAAEMAAAGLAEEHIRLFRAGSRRFQRPADSQQAMEKLEATDPAAADEARRTNYGSWVINEPGKALQWAETRGDTELISRTVGGFANGLLHSDWAPGREARSGWANSIQSQFAVWQRLDAPTADAWLATMPADIRKLVATTATSESDAAR